MVMNTKAGMIKWTRKPHKRNTIVQMNCTFFCSEGENMNREMVKALFFSLDKWKALIMIFLPQWGLCGGAPDSDALPCRQRKYPAHLSRWGKEECHRVHTGYRTNGLQLSSEQHYRNLKSLSRQVHVQYLFSVIRRSGNHYCTYKSKWHSTQSNTNNNASTPKTKDLLLLLNKSFF